MTTRDHIRRPTAAVAAPRRKVTSWRRRIAVIVGGLLVLILVVLAGLWALTPSVGDAEQRAATFTADHHAGTLQGAVPDKYASALVATEDSRFYSHHGIDSLGVARAGLGIFGGQDTGGSTLDQQLAKTLYNNGQRSTTDIVEQVVLGAKLDAAYSKGQILAMYAQVAYFGHGFYGLRDAACGYFNTAPQNLSWSQASLLAGLPQAPSNYDPLTYPQLASQRQHHVLDRLIAVGALTGTQAAQITPQTWHLSTTPTTPAPGCGTGG